MCFEVVLVFCVVLYGFISIMVLYCSVFTLNFIFRFILDL